MSQQPATFIVGFGRSGTTLVQSILAAHPDFFSVPETSFFEYFVFEGVESQGPQSIMSPEQMRRYLRYFTQTTDMRTSMDTNGLASMAAVDFFDAFMQSFNVDEKKRWVEKTTVHIQHMMLIRKFYHDAKFIHVIRDPVGCVGSLKQLRPVDMGDFRIAYVSSFRSLARFWERSVMLPFLYPEQHNVFHLYYEELVRNPEKTVEDMFAFLGARHEKAVLDSFHESVRPLFSGKRCPWQNSNLQPGFHADTVHRHRRRLPARKVWLVERCSARLGRFLGYPAAPRPSWWAVLATLLEDAFLDSLARTRLEHAVRSLLMLCSRGRETPGSDHAEDV